ncbi:MAG TPA: hypothetical protein VK842_10115 [bacterium]|jgi:hypothetical protein|nr:hypothetical protein [bacterium]
MTPILDLLGAAFVGLAVVWPLSFFGHRFYSETVEAELKRHAQEGGH